MKIPRQPILPFIGLWLLISGGVAGQDAQENYLITGMGYARQSVLDEAFSPVRYRGHLGSIVLGYGQRNSRWISELNLEAQGGIQRPEVGQESSNRKSRSGLARLHLHLSRKVYQIGKTDIWAGLESTNYLDFREHQNYQNSSTNYAAWTALGPALSLEYPFTFLKQNFALNHRFSLPVVAYYFRPGFVRPFFNGKLSQTGWAGWPDYQQFNWFAQLNWNLKNANYIRLGYRWEIAQLRPLNRVQTGGHFFHLATVFRLK